MEKGGGDDNSGGGGGDGGGIVIDWYAMEKIHGRGSSMCSCVIKGEMQSISDTSWVPRSEFSFLRHVARNRRRKILLRRLWIRSCSRSPLPLSSRSWMVETWFPGQPLARARDEGKTLDDTGSDLLVSRQLMWDLDFENKFGSEERTCAIKKGAGPYGPFGRTDQPVEEPWIFESSVLLRSVRPEDSPSGVTERDKISDDLDVNVAHSNSLTHSTRDRENTASFLHNRIFKPRASKNEYPVEEPWLLQSSLVLHGYDDRTNIEISRNERSLENEAKNLEPENQHPQIAELLSFGEGIWESVGDDTENQETCNEFEEVRVDVSLDDESRVAMQDSVAKVILINSSLCTMQRIAVMENEKLVEILLEPVKNNVQSDSVYLGVVTKFVPHMGGAFVNIGCPRPSLMDTNHNWEPFIFPPFRRRIKQRNVNGSLLVSEQVKIDCIQEIDIRDDSARTMLYDYGEHDMDDELDESEDFSERVSSAVGSGKQINGKRSLHLYNQHTENSKGSNTDESNWGPVQKGTKIIVQVVKEGLGTKGPTLTAYPKLRSRFWVLMTRFNSIHVSKKIYGLERTRLRVIAKTLQPPGFGLTVRTVAAGHSFEELQKDLDGLLSTWKDITEQAKSAALAADEGVEGAIPVMLHRAMGQTHSVVQDLFNDKVKRMVVDSPQTYHEKRSCAENLGVQETWISWLSFYLLGQLGKRTILFSIRGSSYLNANIKSFWRVQFGLNDRIFMFAVIYVQVTNYLQEIDPDLCDRVELYSKKNPLFDEYEIEEELNNMLSKRLCRNCNFCHSRFDSQIFFFCRVPLSNGGYLVIEQTEALVSVDVNGGQCMLGHGTSQEKAILEVNLAAAKQIAREIRLRDIGGIIVVDFIDMLDESNKRLVYEEVRKAVDRDRSMVKISELSRHGLMEITRKRVRPSVTFMISEPCSCCQATGRVEALETSFSKIEHGICRLLALMERPNLGSPKSWPKFILRVDRYMCSYLTSGKRTRIGILSSSLKVWILLKVARGLTRGAFELKPLTEGTDHGDDDRVAVLTLSPTQAMDAPRRKITIFPIQIRGK
ncbi:Nucleic acid-binding, OB-fold [Cynara cardunculus var. scolymus]|uniref:Nucleic acid-binding, OB-fold n=1 Tax=Cynara cardunculus var. scolymus TaxID=59895 RepID=A0A103YGP0_CYNCS|nr:Nucleic acid-binding, OB-fold [Cynara cardunculus var. scolymus]